MRLIITLPALVLSMAVVCLSCSKSAQQHLVLTPSSPSPHTVQELNAAVTPDGSYELYLSSKEVQIHKQAAHFELSLIGMDSKNGLYRYKYVPAKGFAGSDEVTLSETNYISANGGCNYDDGNMNSTSAKKTSFTKIKFTVK